MVCAFGFGVGGLGLVGRSLRWRVWGWWVEMVSGGLCFWVWGWWVGVGWSWVVLEGLGLVGWGWSGLCLWVWSWWVGVGRSRWVLAGIEWVGWGRSVVDGAVGLVGWGWLVVGCAGRFGVGGLGLVSGGLCFSVWGWWVGVGWS